MKTKLGMLAVLAAISAPAAAGTIDLGVASNYNAFIFGDYTTWGNSVAGALAIGGNATLSSNSIANGKNNEYGLVVGGNFNQVNGGSLNGNAWIGGNNGITQQYSVSGRVDTAATVAAPIDFATAKSELSALSSQLAGVTATGSYAALDQWNQNSKVFTGSGANVEFFSLNASEFASFNNLFFNSIAAGTTLIFNVAGESATLGWQWQGFGSQYNVLFNFYEATSVTLNASSLYASILAVDATINPGSGNLYGTVVANNWNNSVTLGNGSFATADTPLFNNITTAVPEPHHYALLLAGLTVILVTAKRRRKMLTAKV
ncbi:choice-of-anchor A family protein [Methylobacillus flagellatus]|uniref:choice-of-anchor A family protein n=1 Tax=Methylobacillus flagellatus TaxID=405 RepID=UPI00285388C2|nr:choice-of-anchor A family protein [Methylobacillus flagellatus]MDR5171724.1 choice-of-anchor A family protein [Methylobacillus flagellatus]